MHPIVYPRTFSAFCFIKASFTLSNFVCMVNRYVVNTACMNIKMLSKIFHAHCRTFNMPARISATPRTIPCHCLIFKLRFCKPEDKVTRIAFVFVNYNNLTLSCSCFKLIKIQVCKLSVIRICRNIIIKISASHVCVTVCFNLFNKLNHVVNMFSCTADNIRMTDIHCIHILHKGVCIKICNFKNTLMTLSSRFFHFIFTVVAVICKVANISNIHYMLNFIAEQSECFIKNIKEYVSAQVSDMRIVIYCRSTTIESNLTFYERLELLHFVSHCII